MKICPKCNKAFGEQDMFCDMCGVKLENTETVVIAEPETEAVQEKKKGLLWWHILLIVLGVIIVAGAVFCVVHFADKNDDGNENTDENISQEDDTEQKEDESETENSNADNEKESETVIAAVPDVKPEITTKNNEITTDKNENKPAPPVNDNSNNNSDRPDPSEPVTEVKPSSVDAFIDAFMTGKFYMATYDLKSGEKASIAKEGKNFQMSIESEGLQMQILTLNGNTYLVNQNNKYISMDSLTDFVGEDAFDTESITNMIDMLDVSKYDFKNVETGVAELNGDSVNYKKYVADNAELCFYFASGKIKQIELVTDDGTSDFAFGINEYSASIPSSMLTLNNLTESNLFEFVLEMMK